MFLFYRDLYAKRAIVDTETSNKSFIHMAEVLKRLGVKNNMFHLALYQPDLIGVNPHDPDLSLEMKAKVAYECKINPFYAFREVIRIPAQGGDPVPFRLDRANLATIWLFLNGYDVILVQPRQTGKTMSTLAISAYIIYIYGKNLTLSMLTKDNTLRNENVSRLKDIRDGLPKYLIHKQKMKDRDNQTGLEYSASNTKYQTYVAQGDETSAYNLGRGMTTAWSHWDEPSTFKHIHVSYPVAMATMSAAIESAKANGQPHSSILTTNAGVLDTKEGRFCHDIITKSLAFNERYYDVEDKKELDEILNLGSNNGMFYLVYSYLQLGKTHEWLKNTVKRLNADQDTIDRDFYNIWKLGSSKSVLSDETLMSIKTSCKDPLYTEIRDGYVWNWYIDQRFVENHDYRDIPMVLGMDGSENIGRDFTSFVLMDARDMSIVATFRCNDRNVVKVGMYVAKFLLRYTKTLFVPERNSTGMAIIDQILVEFEQHGISPCRRIYNEIVQNRSDSPFNMMELDKSMVDGITRKYLGFRTTGGKNGRNFLYNTIFSKAMQLNANKIYDKTLVEEICGLIVKNGRVDHGPDGHDDSVVAYLLCCYIMFAGKNLEEYGFDNKIFLNSYNEDTGNSRSVEAYQKNLRSQIKIIQSKINNSGSELVRLALYRKLRILKDAVDPNISISDDSTISRNKYENEVKEANADTINMNQSIQLLAG